MLFSRANEQSAPAQRVVLLCVAGMRHNYDSLRFLAKKLSGSDFELILLAGSDTVAEWFNQRASCHRIKTYSWISYLTNFYLKKGTRLASLRKLVLYWSGIFLGFYLRFFIYPRANIVLVLPERFKPFELGLAKNFKTLVIQLSVTTGLKQFFANLGLSTGTSVPWLRKTNIREKRRLYFNEDTGPPNDSNISYAIWSQKIAEYYSFRGVAQENQVVTGRLLLEEAQELVDQCSIGQTNDRAIIFLPSHHYLTAEIVVEAIEMLCAVSARLLFVKFHPRAPSAWRDEIYKSYPTGRVTFIDPDKSSVQDMTVMAQKAFALVDCLSTIRLLGQVVDTPVIEFLPPSEKSRDFDFLRHVEGLLRVQSPEALCELIQNLEQQTFREIAIKKQQKLLFDLQGGTGNASAAIARQLSAMLKS